MPEHIQHGREVPPLTRRAPFRIPFWLGVGLLAAIAVFFLWEEHRAHLLGALPWVLFAAFILACPLLHLFMHGRHVDSDSGAHDPSDRSSHQHTQRGAL